ncbi:MAG: hypothetical protein JSR77_04075 [Planctomycetes bacterium]|nr:hypothetical protein [Planctomycetota bacterium]
MKQLLLIIVACGLVGACTKGNNRVYQGDMAPDNRSQLNTFTDRGGAPPPTSTGASPAGLARNTWEPVTVLVPSDGLASKPYYTKQHFYAQNTARSRGEYPTAVTALELSNDKGKIWRETLESPLWAFWDATRMVGWDLWVTPEWNEHVYPRPDYWRAATTTQRVPDTQDSSEAAR